MRTRRGRSININTESTPTEDLAYRCHMTTDNVKMHGSTLKTDECPQSQGPIRMQRHTM